MARPSNLQDKMLGLECDSGGLTLQGLSKSVKSPESMSPVSTPVEMPNSTARQYLPGFLMGDLRSSPHNEYVSPLLKSPRQRSNDRQDRVVQPQLPNIKVPSFDRSSRRHASPPTQSLWSSTSQAKPCESDNVSANGSSAQRSNNSSSNYLTPDRPDISNCKYSSLFQSPVQIIPSDVSHKNGTVDDETDTWVTVFGYDQSQANFVLQHFSHLGIIEKHIITNGGNWMNIKYANKIQARCALNRNGRVLTGKTMIGVRKCTDLSVMNGVDVVSCINQDMTDRGDSSNGQAWVSVGTNSESRKISDPSAPAPKFGSSSTRVGVKLESPAVLNQSFSGRVGKPGGPVRTGGTNLTRHSSMRPLAAPYQPPPRFQVSRANHFQTFKTGDSRSTSLLSKALDYMFGWN